MGSLTRVLRLTGSSVVDTSNDTDVGGELYHVWTSGWTLCIFESEVKD